MGGWSLYSNLLIMSKEFAVVLGTLATPLAPPLDKVINESVALMNNLLYYGHFLAIKSENTKYYLHVKWNAPSRRIYAKKNVYCVTHFPSSAHRDMMHVGAPHTLCSCSDIINTPWIKQLWQPPESPDAAGKTSVDLTADLGSVCCGPTMIILGPF